ncbi:unnamed protein product, partial [Allacma fusca]
SLLRSNQTSGSRRWNSTNLLHPFRPEPYYATGWYIPTD